MGFTSALAEDMASILADSDCMQSLHFTLHNCLVQGLRSVCGVWWESHKLYIRQFNMRMTGCVVQREENVMDLVFHLHIEYS